MLPKIITILFTNECPLECRYCFGVDRAAGHRTMTEERMRQTIEQGMKDTPAGTQFRVVLTGGEPFIYWKRIQQLMLSYPNIEWEFNTSGILLTQEILEFLSQYRVMFNLSVDGGEKIGRYQRPFLNDKDYTKNFFQEFQKISTTLLYYYPNTPWKTILSKYTQHHLPEIYCDAMRLGFKKFHWVPDLREVSSPTMFRGARNLGQFLPQWEEEQYYDLFISYSQLLSVISASLRQGIIPPLETYLTRYIQYYILDDTTHNFEDLIKCGVFKGRENTAVFGESATTQMCCATKLGLSLDEFIVQMQQELNHNNGKCPNDQNCPHYLFCLRDSCLQDNVNESGYHLTPASFYCKTLKVLIPAIKIFLDEAISTNLIKQPAFKVMCERIRKGGV